MTAVGRQKVTVTYRGESATYEIEVKTIANTQETAYTVDEAIALIDAGKGLSTPVYVRGIVSKIQETFNSKYGNISFYVSADGTEEGSQFLFFRTQKDADNKYTEDPNIEVGASVIGYGTLAKYNNTYEYKAGNYLVSYFAPVSVNFVAKNNAGYWATFSSDKVTFFPNDVEVDVVTVENKELLPLALDKVSALIDGKDVEGYYVPANTGVLLYSTTETANYYIVENKEVKAVDADLNMLQPASKPMTENTDCTFFKLAYDDYKAKTGLGFYYGAADGAAFDTKTGTAYLAVPNAQATSVKGFSFDGIETGIAGVETENGNNAVIYNLSGQRVQKAQHGLYIVNGKKYMVK